jgi:hypothetical protein
MSMTFKGLAAFSCLLLTALPASAKDLAARAPCTCETQSNGGGVFASVDGEVSTLGTNGFVPAREGAPISVGTRVVVARGSAILRFADRCRNVAVGPNSDVDVTRVGKNICIRVAQQNLPDGVGAGNGTGGASGAAEGLGLGAVGVGALAIGAVGIIAIGLGKANGPSPVSP